MDIYNSNVYIGVSYLVQNMLAVKLDRMAAFDQCLKVKDGRYEL